MGVPISMLPEATTLAEDAVFAVVDNEETKKISLENLRSEIVGDQVVSRTTDTTTVTVPISSGSKSMQMGWHITKWDSGFLEAYGFMQITSSDSVIMTKLSGTNEYKAVTVVDFPDDIQSVEGFTTPRILSWFSGSENNHSNRAVGTYGIAQSASEASVVLTGVADDSSAPATRGVAGILMMHVFAKWK